MSSVQRGYKLAQHETGSVRCRMPPPTPKDDWIAAFVAELTIRLRPDIGRRFAETIAANAWARCKDMTPQEAAKLWSSPRSSKP